MSVFVKGYFYVLCRGKQRLDMLSVLSRLMSDVKALGMFSSKVTACCSSEGAE